MSKYLNEYDYIPELPHLESWSKGIKIKNIKGTKQGNSCQDYQKKVTHQYGPQDGFTITLKGLPSSKGKSVFIRFWAAKPGQDWDSFKEAYDEFTQDYEEMPSQDYNNSGMVKVSAAGIAKFKLRLPVGYKKGNKKVPPHFHYRLCINGKMGPVHTQYLKKQKANLYIIYHDILE